MQTLPWPTWTNAACLRKAPAWVRQAYVDAVTEALNTGQLPHWGKEGEVSFLYKKGDPLTLASYRPITLLPVVAKILAHHLRIHIEKELGHLLGHTQHRFRKGHGTTTAAFQALAILRRKGGGYLLRLDVAKAFDSVPHRSLQHLLQHAGLDQRSLNGVFALYDNAATYPRVHGFTGKAMRLRYGVRQGCPLSPTLFAIWLAPLLHIVDACGPRSLGAFADDIQIVAFCIRKLQELLDEFERLCLTWSLQLRPSKTTFVSSREGPAEVKMADGTVITAEPFSKPVKVLGHLVARNDGVLSTHLIKEVDAFFASL